MNQQDFDLLMERLEGDEFRDSLDSLLEQEVLTSEQISLVLKRMNLENDFEGIEHYGFATLKNLIKQTEVSFIDLNTVTNTILKLYSEFDEWSMAWLDTFEEGEIEELCFVANFLSTRTYNQTKAKQLTQFSKELSARKRLDPSEIARMELLLDTARSKKTPKKVLESLATNSSISIRIAVSENPTTSKETLEILANDSNRKIASIARTRLSVL